MAKKLENGDWIRYLDQQDLEEITSALRKEGYKYLVSYGYRIVLITKVPGEEESNGNDKDDH